LPQFILDEKKKNKVFTGLAHSQLQLPEKKRLATQGAVIRKKKKVLLRKPVWALEK